MPSLLCECGHLYEADPGPAFCPACGRLHPLTAPKIKVLCLCGKDLKAPAALAGKSAKCPACGEMLQVPQLDVAAIKEEWIASLAPSPAIPEDPPIPPLVGARRFLPLLFAFTLVPLLLSVFSKDDDFKARLDRTVTSHPDEVKSMMEKGDPSLDAFLRELPEHRIEGAHLPRDTWMHWVYAGVAAVVLWGAVLALYPLGRATAAQLWKIGIFTGTIGILLLLAIQYVAEFTQGWIITGGSPLVLIFYVFKFIGFSYHAALNPENGFLLSMFGFTFGVGLCEELFKALPLIWHYRGKATLDLRGAIAWGLASGVGFGISEGITYSSDFYNGASTGGIYVVRFVSCVGLHAAWSGATAVLLYRRQQDLRDVESWYEWAIPVLKILAVAMVLHGLYDTLLKRDMEVWAVVTAVASFAWFFAYADYTRRLEGDASPAPATA